MNVFDALRRGLDRAGFEADKVMRANRVRGEGLRLKDQINDTTLDLGERVLEMHAAGELTDPKLLELAQKIADLKKRAAAKNDEANAIMAEVWPEPVDATPASSPAPPAALPAPAPPASEASTRHCDNCGAELRANALFCPVCGTRVAA